MPMSMFYSRSATLKSATTLIAANCFPHQKLTIEDVNSQATSRTIDQQFLLDQPWPGAEFRPATAARVGVMVLVRRVCKSPGLALL